MKSSINKNPKYQFSTERWIVSLVSLNGKFGKEFAIVIEGLEFQSPEIQDEGMEGPNAQDPRVKSTRLNITEYHLTPHNITTLKDKISADSIPAAVGLSYTQNPNYNPKLLSVLDRSEIMSWSISKARAIAMITAIRKEQESGAIADFQDRLSRGIYKILKNQCQLTLESWCTDVLAVVGIEHKKTLGISSGDIPTNPEIKHEPNNDVVVANNSNPSSYWYLKPQVVVPVLTAGAALVTFVLSKNLG